MFLVGGEWTVGSGSPDLTPVPLSLSLSLKAELHCSFECYQVLRDRSLSSKKNWCTSDLWRYQGMEKQPSEVREDFFLSLYCIFYEIIPRFEQIGYSSVLS